MLILDDRPRRLLFSSSQFLPLFVRSTRSRRKSTLNACRESYNMADFEKHQNGQSSNVTDLEKHDDGLAFEPAGLGEHARGRQFSLEARDVAMVETDQNVLHRRLKGRHMQMIAM